MPSRLTLAEAPFCGGKMEKEHEEIAITDAMIAAAANVLWRHPMLDIPEGFAEGLALEMMKSALLVSGCAMSATLPPLTNELLDAGTNALEDILLNLCDGFVTPQDAVEQIYSAIMRRALTTLPKRASTTP